MEITTTSWHYRLYRAGYTTLGKCTPDSTSLCVYFWRVVLTAMLFAVLSPLAFLGLFLLRAVALLLYPLVAFIGLFFGVRPTNKYYGFTGYKPFQIGRFQFYPATPLGYSAFLSVTYNLVISTTVTSDNIYPLITVIFMAAVLFIGFPLLAADIPKKYRVGPRSKQSEKDPEPKTLVGQYIQAKKDRICPLIEFRDPSQDPFEEDTDTGY